MFNAVCVMLVAARPKYRKHAATHSGQLERGISLDKHGRDLSCSFGEKLASAGSKRLKDAEVTVVQVIINSQINIYHLLILFNKSCTF